MDRLAFCSLALMVLICEADPGYEQVSPRRITTGGLGQPLEGSQ